MQSFVEKAMTTPTEPRRSALSAVRPGTDAAFEAAFRQHWVAVYGVLVRLTGDPAAADDLALETFWRLWHRPPARHDNTAAWLYRVAVNLGYNALRAARRRAGYEARAGLAAAGAAPADPAASAERAEARDRVRAVLRALPARDARLLVLRQAGLSYDEIAAALRVAPGSVGTLLARAERSFEQRLASLGGSAGVADWSER